MPHPLKKAGRSLAQCFGQFRRFVYLKHHRLLIEDGLADVSLPSLASLSIREVPVMYRSGGGFELGQDSNPCATGAGVYRGEAKVIQELGLSISSHRWVLSSLLQSDLAFVDKDTASNLLCLAHHLQCEKQFYPPMTDLQKREIIRLDACPLVTLYSSPLASSCVTEAVRDVGSLPLGTVLTKNQECQRCQRLSSKAKELCWCCQHHSCPPFYHKNNTQDSGIIKETQK